MTFYLAGKLHHRMHLRVVRDLLQAAGHEVKSRWLDSTAVGETGDSSFWAAVDRNDIDECDILVLFNLPVENPDPSIGRFIEYGYAMASRKVRMVVGAGESVFFHDAVRYETVGQFVHAQYTLSEVGV